MGRHENELSSKIQERGQDELVKVVQWSPGSGLLGLHKRQHFVLGTFEKNPKV